MKYSPISRGDKGKKVEKVKGKGMEIEKGGAVLGAKSSPRFVNMTVGGR